MHDARDRIMASLIALFLMSAMAVSLVALPTANAESTRATYAFIGATPNPVGVGQETLLHVGITQQLNSVAMGWEGLSVTVTKPDGTTETISNIRTDSTGGTGYIYTPTMAGNYTLQTHFPAQNTTSSKQAGSTPVGTWMLASDSAKLTLVVLPEPVAIYPGFPLPTEYWTRPINAQLREWASIAGNWPSAPENGLIAYDVDAPETAHVLWTKQIAMGGLAGGDIVGINGPGIGFEEGAAYEQKFGAPVVLGGILFYNRFESRGQPYAGSTDVVAVDLHTGEELWCKPLIGRTGNTTGATVAAADRVIDGVSAQFPDGIGRRLNNGQLFYWQSYNYMGAYALLWTVSGSTWMAFDAFTGRWIYTITNSPATTGSYAGLGSNTFFGEHGEILAYTINQAAGWMALWNSSSLVSEAGSWNPHGNVYNATGRTGSALAAGPARAWEWNITIPKGLAGSARDVALGERVVGSNVNTTDVNIWAFSLKPGQEGQLLYNNDWKAPADWNSGNQTISWVRASLEDNVGIVDSKETMQYWGFNLQTGQYLWGPSEPEQYLQYLGTSTAVAYGKFYSTYMCGIVYCYDIQTGKRLWTHAVTDPLNEILWSPNWPVRIQFIADGKIYLCEGEHSPNIPLPRGAPYLCLNATTGEQIWSISITYYYRTNTVIGDNIIAVHSLYDNSIYAIGKGPSATSVLIRNDIVTAGDSMLIQGMVTDTSPGTEDYGLKVRFPNGVPAVSDESMKGWMEYLYEQFPRPGNATGVQVSIDAIDPNSNWIHIGTATSDTSGLFSYMWETPDVPGKYTVIATFAGSGAYYASYAETAMAVQEAPPSPTPTPAAPQPPDATPTVIAATVAIIIAVAIAAIWIKRK